MFQYIKIYLCNRYCLLFHSFVNCNSIILSHLFVIKNNHEQAREEFVETI